KKDFEWIRKNNRGAEVWDESENWGQLAVQGPKASELVSRIFGKEIVEILPFHFSLFHYRNSPIYLARTGYTGEDGFEIFVGVEEVGPLWDELLEKGKDLKVSPIGLGARDTLRTEMKFPLYGHEIDDSTNPYSAGLGWVVKPDKKEFIGRQKILEVKEAGLTHKLVGIKMRDRGIARQGYGLFSFDNKEIGKVTSGTVSPNLGENIGIAYLLIPYSSPGTEIMVEIRGKRLRAVVEKTPFVTPGSGGHS
ncbi:MAG: glycine cleavage system protein T, partial [Bdellovibrionales bacterium]|nr:glycine cleavage system protein T [Bdellovibrionales bacterium]